MSTILILDALRRTLLTGVGVKLVVVDALDERAAVFYERREFRRFTGRPLRLYLPMNRDRELLPGEGSDPGRAFTMSAC